MLRGKPCIGGNHGGTPDVIEHGGSGFLVEYGNVDELASRVKCLMDDNELCHGMGARGRHLASTKFSFEQFRTRYDEFAT